MRGTEEQCGMCRYKQFLSEGVKMFIKWLNILSTVFYTLGLSILSVQGLIDRNVYRPLAFGG